MPQGSVYVEAPVPQWEREYKRRNDLSSRWTGRLRRIGLDLETMVRAGPAYYATEIAALTSEARRMLADPRSADFGTGTLEDRTRLQQQLADQP